MALRYILSASFSLFLHFGWSQAPIRWTQIETSPDSGRVAISGTNLAGAWSSFLRKSNDTLYVDGVVESVGGGGGGVGGSGTTGRIPLWTGSTTLGNSVLTQETGQIGFNNLSPAFDFDLMMAAGGFRLPHIATGGVIGLPGAIHYNTTSSGMQGYSTDAFFIPESNVARFTSGSIPYAGASGRLTQNALFNFSTAALNAGNYRWNIDQTPTAGHVMTWSGTEWESQAAAAADGNGIISALPVTSVNIQAATNWFEIYGLGGLWLETASGTPGERLSFFQDKSELSAGTTGNSRATAYVDGANKEISLYTTDGATTNYGQILVRPGDLILDSDLIRIRNASPGAAPLFDYRMPTANPTNGQVIGYEGAANNQLVWVTPAGGGGGLQNSGEGLTDDGTTVSLDINGLLLDQIENDDDEVLFYDTGTGTHRKTLIGDIKYGYWVLAEDDVGTISQIQPRQTVRFVNGQGTQSSINFSQKNVTFNLGGALTAPVTIDGNSNEFFITDVEDVLIGNITQQLYMQLDSATNIAELTGTEVWLGQLHFDGASAVGAGQDGYHLVYNHANGTIGLQAPAATVAVTYPNSFLPPISLWDLLAVAFGFSAFVLSLLNFFRNRT